MSDTPSPQPPIPARPVRATPDGQQASHEEERDNPGQATGGTGGVGAPPPDPTPIDEPVPDPVRYPPGSRGEDETAER